MATPLKKRRRADKDSDSSVGRTGSNAPLLESPNISIGGQSETPSNMEDDIEVYGRDLSSDIAGFLEIVGELEKTVTSVYKEKLNAIANIKTHKLDSSKRRNITFQFVTLKQLNRLSQIQLKQARDKTNECKKHIDTVHLQLTNLLYEAMHLHKDISRCLEFKSSEEEIELVPVEEFYAKAPKSISRPDITKKDAHQQMLSRLDWELEERKQLTYALSRAMEGKLEMAHAITQRASQLAGIKPRIESILEATGPVQTDLGLNLTATHKLNERSVHLSNPLFILYTNLTAYKEVIDSSLGIAIDGDTNAEKLDGSKNAYKLIVEEDSDSDVEEEGSKRIRRSGASSKAETLKEKVLTVHPMSVTMTLKHKGVSVFVTFSYLPVVNVVTIRVGLTLPDKLSSQTAGELLSPSRFLHCLYPGDSAAVSPNPASLYLLERLHTGDSPNPASLYLLQRHGGLGTPYRWAQRLCGFDFPGLPALVGNDSHTALQNVVKLIENRVAIRLALVNQLAALESRSINVTPDYLATCPTKVSAKFTSWKNLTPEEYSALGFTAKQTDSEEPTTDLEDERLFYLAQFDRNSVSIQSAIVLTADYPLTPPLLSLRIGDDRTAATDSAVRAVERRINLDHGRLAPHGLESLLSHQLHTLLYSLDIYFDTEAGNGVERKERSWLRRTKSRDRSRPMEFNKKLNMFTHSSLNIA